MSMAHLALAATQKRFLPKKVQKSSELIVIQQQFLMEKNSRKLLKNRLTLIEGRFGDLQNLLAAENITEVDGIVLDVGVSSMQLDQSERGFSFAKDGPLDMRMELSGKSAADVVNEVDEADLRRIISVLGEEKRAYAVAKAIVKRREQSNFTRTVDLAEVIEKVMGAKAKAQRIHPATRTFQALRIFVNNELDQLVRGLVAAEQVLRPDGVLAVVSFHSLEDRIVKRFFTERTGKTSRPSRHMPEEVGRPDPSFTDLTRGGIVADEEEIAANPRSRSARLRAGKRTLAAAFAMPELNYTRNILGLKEAPC